MTKSYASELPKFFWIFLEHQKLLTFCHIVMSGKYRLHKYNCSAASVESFYIFDVSSL